MVAPRACALSSDSMTKAPAPSAMTKPSRSLEKGLEAFSGTSFWVDSADSSEKRTSASAVTEPSVPTEMTRSASPRRIASTPSWIAVAPEAQAVDRVIGRPRVPSRSCSFWPTVPNWIERKKSRWLAAARGQQQAVVARLLAAGFASVRVELQALPPFELDRRGGEEERAAEIAFRQAGFADRLERRGLGQRVGQCGGTGLDRRHEIDRAGDGGAQMLGRKAVDAVDAGLAGGQLAQLSSLPAPSEETTPAPVMAMIGRPA
jgi:hypothetical protein